MSGDRSGWPNTGRLLTTGPLPEIVFGPYSAEAKAAWQPWVDAARAGASIETLRGLEPGVCRCGDPADCQDCT